jgi:hypothetical protein
MKITDKISKADDTISIRIVDNGFLLEVSGRDSNDDWKTARIVCTNRDQLNKLLDEAFSIDRTE